ncbi:hypothetical protein Cni_G00452 [Canna indica]|uniref:N-acetyltransferase domain-containing protein n=1 Tax=Canna indica TaxID=4628 RepID=A0AAQ3JKW4_9LILI|nr:hypothetical protein Cni_G00452 [Canna indica]
MEEEEDEKKAAPEINLRPFEFSDLDDFMTWASDDRIMRVSHRPTCATAEDALAHLKDLILPHPWYRAICVGGRAVGCVSVTPAAGRDVHRASIGYGVAYAYWGRGIATAAVRKAASAVFAEWPQLKRLEAVAEESNRASQRVLQKAGFQREGLLRSYVVLRGESKDVVMYSLLSTDPKVQ